MEGGSRFIEWITYGMIAIVLFAMIYFLARTLKLALGFLSLPLSDALQRWGFARRWLDRRSTKAGDANGQPPEISSR